MICKEKGTTAEELQYKYLLDSTQKDAYQKAIFTCTPLENIAELKEIPQKALDLLNKEQNDKEYCAAAFQEIIDIEISDEDVDSYIRKCLLTHDYDTVFDILFNRTEIYSGNITQKAREIADEVDCKDFFICNKLQ